MNRFLDPCIGARECRGSGSIFRMLVAGAWLPSRRSGSIRFGLLWLHGCVCTTGIGVWTWLPILAPKNSCTSVANFNSVSLVCSHNPSLLWEAKDYNTPDLEVFWGHFRPHAHGGSVHFHFK